MGDSLIIATHKMKYLGVIIDNKITWIPHITYVKNKVSKCIGIMFKARNDLKRDTLINLYHSYIYPYLIYCIEAWGNATNCHLEQLYLTQKKVARFISFSNDNTHSIDTNSDVHNYTTRQKHFLHVNKSNINIYPKSFGNTSARIWNVLQSEG